MEPGLRWEICLDCNDPEELAPFWEALLGYRRVGEPGSGQYLTLRDPDGAAPPILLQRVPEPKTTKNRLHVDVYTREPEALLARAVELGATPVGERIAESSGVGWFQVLTDPAGNEFCVCTENEDTTGG